MGENSNQTDFVSWGHFISMHHLPTNLPRAAQFCLTIRLTMKIFRTNPPPKQIRRRIPKLYLLRVLGYLHKEMWVGMGFDSILHSTPASNPLGSGDKFCKYWCCPVLRVLGIYWCLPGDWQCFSRPKWILENRKQPIPRYIIRLEKHVSY